MREICNNSKQAEELKEKILEYRQKDFRQVLNLCSVLEKYAYQTDDRELLGFVYFYTGEAYYVLNEVESMFQSMVKSMTYLSETEQWELLTRVYNMMAIVSINRGHTPVALDYYLTALKCAKEHEVESVICSIHINLGYLYMQNKIYEEAQYHFYEAYDIYSASMEKDKQIGRLIMIYTNLITCYMLRGNMENAESYMNRLMSECSSHFNYMDDVYVGCMESKYYHLCKDYDKRDEIIDKILNRLEEQLPLLDLFDDLYSICELTLKIEKYDVFLQILEKLEPIVLQNGLDNLYRKLLILKIQYYEIKGEKCNYDKAAGQFFQLSLKMEEENHIMIANMIQVRTALENAQESKKKIEEINEILTQKSETDQLTGLGNRYRMLDISAKVIEECKKEKKLLSVEVIDIDYFKKYNDTYGHQVGDECIKKVASVIRKYRNDNVFCFRYGGDEFIMIYNGLEEEKVLEISKKLRKDIMDLKINDTDFKIPLGITISQGICQAVPSEDMQSKDYIYVADGYLYNVKKHGRNNICFGNMKKECSIVI